MAPNPIYPGNGLEIGFLGLPIVFNDGQAENTLQIALTNNNFFGSLEPAQDSDIVFNQDTPLSIWFVVDVAQASAGAERYWALSSYDALHDARVSLTAGPGDWDIRRSDDLSGTPLNDSLKGWRLTAREDVVLSPGQSLLLTLSGLTTDLPDGPAFGYVQVIMPHLDANNNEARNLTKTIGPITKSKVMITGERMGIGTGSPNSALEVNGAVRARGGDPGDDGYDNNGFFFDGVGDTDSGMTSLEDGDLSFYINDNHALRIQKPLADGSSGGNIRAALRGNLLIQADSPVELFVDGEATFSGDIKSKGAIETDGEARFGGDIKSNGRIMDQTGDLMPVGAIIAYGGSKLPPGWLLCDGAVVPEDKTYDKLRGVLGEGATLPDLQSRFVVGTGTGTVTDQLGNVLTTYSLNGQGGAESVKLDVTQIPSHTHSIDQHLYFHHRSFEGSDSGASPLKRYHEDDKDITLYGTDPAGGDQPHENRPPYYALTYIIKY